MHRLDWNRAKFLSTTPSIRNLAIGGSCAFLHARSFSLVLRILTIVHEHASHSPFYLSFVLSTSDMDHFVAQMAILESDVCT